MAIPECNRNERPVIDELSIVIPTLGRDMLRDCLLSIVEGDAWPAQIIVIDQGRKAELEAYIHSLNEKGIRIEYVPSAERGRPSGLNRGLERVRTRYVAFTDDDCLVADNWISKMHAHLASHAGCVITGRVMPQGDGLAVSTITSMEGRTYSRRSLTIDPLVGCNMGASMDLFKQIGFFDEKPCLRTAEDCELSYRVLSAGIKIIYEPEIVIHHISWRDSDAQSKQYNDYATSHGAFYGKYLRRGDMFILLRILIHYARSLKRWFIGIVTFNADRRRNGRAYCMRLIPGIIAGMRAG